MDDSRMEGLDSAAIFCHAYDLTRHLDNADMKGELRTTPFNTALALSLDSYARPSPFKAFLKDVQDRLIVSQPSVIHRICVPNLLLPTLHGPALCQPSEVLQFMHGLRSLLRQFSNRLTAILTLPTSLYPRSTGLTRWIELLSDGVIEMMPLQEKSDSLTVLKSEEPIQGLMKFHRLPLHHEKGGGSDSGNVYEDLSFRLGVSTGLIIKPYSLPPVGEIADRDSNKPDTPGIHLEF
jgi:elongator complex protein 4